MILLGLRRCKNSLLRILHPQRRAPVSPRQLSSQPYTSRNGKKIASNPGVNVEQFRALFQAPQGKMRQPRYKLRWDWHLRNFLTALVPPAAMFVFFKLVALLDNPEIQLYETQFEGKDPITGKISTVQSPSKDHPLEQRTEHVQKEELHIFLQKILKDRLKPIEEELERLQSLMAESIRVASESEEKSKRIEKARQHSKKMIRSEVKKNAD